MDLVAVLCGHLNRLHAHRERDWALQDLRYILTKRIYWVHRCKYDRRRKRGLYTLSTTDCHNDYLLRRLLGQLQRGVIAPTDVIDAAIEVAYRDHFPTSCDCPWCNVQAKEVMEGWRRDWDGRWPVDNVLVAALARLRSLHAERDRHSADCLLRTTIFQLPDPTLWEQVQNVFVCAKVLVTHREAEENENRCIWLPLTNNKGPLGCNLFRLEDM